MDLLRHAAEGVDEADDLVEAVRAVQAEERQRGRELGVRLVDGRDGGGDTREDRVERVLDGGQRLGEAVERQVDLRDAGHDRLVEDVAVREVRAVVVDGARVPGEVELVGRVTLDRDLAVGVAEAELVGERCRP